MRLNRRTALIGTLLLAAAGAASAQAAREIPVGVFNATTGVHAFGGVLLTVKDGNFVTVQ